MNNYLDLSIDEIHELLVKKEIKPIDLVMEALNRIENDDLNSFITINKEKAIKRAIELENNIDKKNPLYGIPISLKDNIITKDLRTTAGSKMLENFIPIYNAHVTDLLEQNGMIIIGKTNMDEFAMGSSSGTSYFGPVKNPWNKKLVSGGSSGGSAASVAKNLTPLSLGSDTGGSIRQPSAFCNTVGLKPTYGRVSRYGLIAFASSLDQIGPITRNVKENAYLLNAITKKDKRDLTNIDKEEDFTRFIGDDISGMKVAIPNFYISDVIDKEILDRFNEILNILTSKGVKIDKIDMPYIEHAVPLYQIIALGEASSNLARYDGIKYGYSTSKAKNIEEHYYKTRSEAFGDEVKRRIMIGSFMLSGKNVEEYFEKALKIRKHISLEFEKIFKEYDLVLGPTTTCLPYELGTSLEDPNKSFIDDILTIPVNMAGLPGMSLPIGFSKDSLPIGMQIISDKWNEAIIYKFAYYLEKYLNLDIPKGGKNE